METLITIALLLLLTAVSNWLQKRNQGKAEDTLPEADQAPHLPQRRESRRLGAPPTAPSVPPQKPSGWDWAAELRRILEENTGETPRSAPQPTPDLAPARPPAPVSTLPKPMVVTPAKTIPPKPSPAPPPVVIEPVIESDIFTASKKAHETASRLSEQVEEHIRQATAYKGSAPISRREQQLSGEVTAALAWLHQPSSARQAFILSTVLDPPKALE